MEHSRVEFYTFDGTLLRRDYFPVKASNAPLVIMTQGLILLKDCHIDDTARRFQEAGVAALVYDHRGWGSSEGTPHNETDPLQQAKNYHDAVTFAMNLAPAIDPSRIGIWGIGHSGGASMIAASDDPRIKAAILNMPFTSRQRDIAGFPAGGLDEAWTDREEQARNPKRSSTCVPVWDDSPAQAKASGDAALFHDGRTVWLHGEEPYAFISGGVGRSHKAGTLWENRITLQSMYKISEAEPEDHIAKIAPRSFLYLAGTSDVLTGPLDNHKRVFERAKNANAEFVTLDDHHIANYFRNFEQSVTAQVDYLKRKL